MPRTKREQAALERLAHDGRVEWVPPTRTSWGGWFSLKSR